MNNSMNDKRSKFLLCSLVLDKIKGSMMERKLWNEYFFFTENQPTFFSYRDKTEVNYYAKGRKDDCKNAARGQKIQRRKKMKKRKKIETKLVL